MIGSAVWHQSWHHIVDHPRMNARENANVAIHCGLTAII